MGNRLSKIYTRTGDDGTTGLGDGSRVAKTHLRVAALGDIDELNAQLGLILASAVPSEASAVLTQIQHDLFNAGAELCLPQAQFILPSAVLDLERQIDAWNMNLPALKEFILPGGCLAAAHCHLARTVARRAERTLIALHQENTLNKALLQYVNRLSDLLFVLCRWLNKAAGVNDVLWQNPKVTKL